MAEELQGSRFLADGADMAALVRVVLELSHADPFTLLSSGVDDEERVFAWNDPADGRCFVGLGCADAESFQGKARFERAAEAVSAWSGGLLFADEEWRGLPLAVGGFAFAESEGAREGAWRGWSDGDLWIPELLVQRKGGRTQAAVTLLVLVGESPERVEQRMQVAMERLSVMEPTATLDVTCVVGGQDQLDEEEGFSRWQVAVERAVEKVSDATLQKVVLARTACWQSSEAEVFDAVGTALEMRAEQEDCTVFLLRGGGQGDFVGATPEELVRLSGGWAHTAALAGTRRRIPGQDSIGTQELLESPKDRLEHRLVAETIREALSPLLEGIQGVGTPSVASYADVHHLRADFSGMVCDGVGLLQLVKTLHPTPAVGGLPKAEALSWLQENEELDRGWYSSPVGWIDGRGDGVFVVGIRSANVCERTATAYAGCGLVRQSDARNEWEESLAKLGTIRRSLVRKPRPTGVKS